MALAENQFLFVVNCRFQAYLRSHLRTIVLLLITINHETLTFTILRLVEAFGILTDLGQNVHFLRPKTKLEIGNARFRREWLLGFCSGAYFLI